MSIDWGAVQEIVKMKATRYADKKKNKDLDAQWSDIFNAYYDGLMECAGERESLRVMNENLRKVTIGDQSNLKNFELKVVVDEETMNQINDDFADLI